MEKFYIQNTSNYIGNCMMWWALESRGYTSNIENAHKYTKEEAVAICRGSERARMWPCDYIDKHTTKVVDMQHPDPEHAYDHKQK